MDYYSPACPLYPHLISCKIQLLHYFLDNKIPEANYIFNTQDIFKIRLKKNSNVI